MQQMVQSWEGKLLSKNLQGVGENFVSVLVAFIVKKEKGDPLDELGQALSSEDSRRVYKARYYPNGSFLTAELGGNTSFVCNSVFESQHLIKKGAAVRIGCGDTVQVLKNPWLPSHYSVKSVYKSLQEDNGERHTNESSGFWRKIWNLKVPPKVKNLLWRVAAGCLPTKSHLQTKHVQVNELCPFCNAERETISHVLITCSYSKDCWNRLGIGVPTLVSGTFSSWLDEIFSRFVDGERMLISMVAWALWKCRNDLVWDNKNKSTGEVVTLATTVLNQWQSAQDKTQNTTLGYSNSQDGDECWHSKCLIL
uniref:Reverse transcriptase zinc-binding domain-containing protein n=1 Tax=Cannabis sativa TaxID=3483 RepID=A0A803NL91_CANSA